MKKIFWRNKESILLLLLLVFCIFTLSGKEASATTVTGTDLSDGGGGVRLEDENHLPIQWRKAPLWKCSWNVSIKSYHWYQGEWGLKMKTTLDEPSCSLGSNQTALAGSNNFCYENDLRNGIIDYKIPIGQRTEFLLKEREESLMPDKSTPIFIDEGQVNCCCEEGNTHEKTPLLEINIPNKKCHWAPIDRWGDAGPCPSENNVENSLAYCVENDLALNIISKDDFEENKDSIKNDPSLRCCCTSKLPERDLNADDIFKNIPPSEGYSEIEEDDDLDARDGCGWYCGDKYGKGISEVTGEEREGDWTGFKYIGCYITCWLAKTLVFIFILPAALFVVIGTITASLLISIFTVTIKALISVPIKDAVVVKEMWMFVRDFANIFYILFFVIIGLATILRIENYKFQKTLPLLLIMALLTNFSLPLIGLVVDIGNVLTNIFVEGVVSNASSGGVTDLGWGYFGDIGRFFIGSGGNFGDLFAQGLGWASYGIVLSLFLLFMVVIFFAIILIFFIRIAALWIVAILSPLAFASYPFQVTRNIVWKEWLKNLFQWTIISVPVLFFVFIGFQVMNLNPREINETFGTDALTANLEEGETISSSIGQPKNLFGKLIEQIMSPLVALLIMGLGVGISMKIAPEGAKKAANLAVGAATGAGGFVAGKAVSGLRNIPKVGEAEMAAKERLESSRVGRLVGLKPGGARAEEAKQLEKHKESLKNMAPERHENYVKSFRGRERDRASAAALMNKMDAGRPISEKERDLYLPRAQNAVGFNVDKFNKYDPTFKDMRDSKGKELTEKEKANLILKIPAEKLASQLSDDSYARASNEVLRSMLKVITLSNQSFNKWFASSSSSQREEIIRYARENRGDLTEKQGFDARAIQKLITQIHAHP